MVVMPADHAIGPAASFLAAIRQAAEWVERQPERIVTFGIRPTYPAESFGYIERGAIARRAGGSAAMPSPASAKSRRRPWPANIWRRELFIGTPASSSGGPAR